LIGYLEIIEFLGIVFDGNFRGKTKTYDFQTPQSVEIDFSGK